MTCFTTKKCVFPCPIIIDGLGQLLLKRKYTKQNDDAVWCRTSSIIEGSLTAVVPIFGSSLLIFRAGYPTHLPEPDTQQIAPLIESLVEENRKYC